MDNNYYKFDSKGSLVTLAVYPVLFDKAITENDWTEEGGRYMIQHLIRGEHNDYIHFPVEFKIRDGKTIRDVIEIRCMGAFLISERLKVIFEEAGLTGWRTYDVIIRKKNGELLPGYYGFQVAEKRPLISPTGMQSYPDFFRTEYFYWAPVCSQKVIDVLRIHNIKDFETELITVKDGEIFLGKKLEHFGPYVGSK